MSLLAFRRTLARSIDDRLALAAQLHRLVVPAKRLCDLVWLHRAVTHMELSLTQLQWLHQ